MVRILGCMTILLFFMGIFGVAGFFALGIGGEFVGFFISLILILMITVLADRLFLVAIKAKEIDSRNHKIYFLLQNITCYKRIGEVRLYRTYTLTPNVYCLHPFFGFPCVIISDKILDTDDEEIWNSSLNLALEHIQEGKGQLATLVSFLTAFIFMPVYFLRHWKLNFLSVIYGYFIYPVLLVKDYVKETSNRVKPNNQLLRLTYFLERFSSNNSSFVDDLSSDFAVFGKRNLSLWPSVLGSFSSLKNYQISWDDKKE